MTRVGASARGKQTSFKSFLILIRSGDMQRVRFILIQSTDQARAKLWPSQFFAWETTRWEETLQSLSQHWGVTREAPASTGGCQPVGSTARVMQSLLSDTSLCFAGAPCRCRCDSQYRSERFLSINSHWAGHRPIESSTV